MAKPLDIDLRKRVIAAVDDNMSEKDVAIKFNVCLRSVYNWLKLRAETNSIKPRSGYQHGHSHKIKDWKKFKTFVNANKYCTIEEMKAKWMEYSGDKVSASVIQRGLSKIGYSFKKKLLISKKPTNSRDSNI